MSQKLPVNGFKWANNNSENSDMKIVIKAIFLK